jgi:HEAT repeat protein
MGGHNGTIGWCGAVTAALLGWVLLSGPAIAEEGQGEGQNAAAEEAAELEQALSSDSGQASQPAASPGDSNAGSSQGDGSPAEGGSGAASPGADGSAGSDDGVGSAVDGYLDRLRAMDPPRHPAQQQGDPSEGAVGSGGADPAQDEPSQGDRRSSDAARSRSGSPQQPRQQARPGSGSEKAASTEQTPQGGSNAGSNASGSGSTVRSLPKPPKLKPLKPEEAEALEPAEARQRAVHILVRAAVGEDPALRSNAIEALSLMPGRALPLTNKALNDPNPGVRFAAAVTAAKLGFKSLIPTLKPLLDDENPSVQAAALSALHKLGEDVNITPLAGMLRERDPQLRGNVALLLGLLGDESAVPMLQRAAKAPLPRASAARAAVVRVQVAEAIARLESDAALDALRAGMFSQFGEVRVVAVNAMGAVGDERMAPALENMLRDELPVELQIAAAAALARMNRSSGLDRVLDEIDHERPAVRAQAAWALGWYSRDAGLSELKRLLADESQQVRVSAAASVLRRLDGNRGAGQQRRRGGPRRSR